MPPMGLESREFGKVWFDVQPDRSPFQTIFGSPLFEGSYVSRSCRRIIRIEVISLLFRQHYPRYDTNPGLIQATYYGGSFWCEIENSNGDFCERGGILPQCG